MSYARAAFEHASRWEQVPRLSPAACLLSVPRRAPTAEEDQEADSTRTFSQAVPHPSTYGALRRVTLEVRRDPVL